jgi:hypothetical protein
MKKRKLNQRRYRQGEKPQPQAVKASELPDETMLEHIIEMVSMLEGRRITLAEARLLAAESEKERETTPP